jgi:RNA polymerase subunit RPABC4/transcription elongation factor Spt4
LAQKGVTRDGETYCLKCKSSVDATIERCPSCDSVFQEDVKAFFCPRCKSLLTLGTSECPQCGMKFRVKAMRHADVPVDQESQAAEDAEPVDRKEAGETPLSAEDDEGIPEEQLELLRGLLRSFTGLADDRATLLERMVARVNDEKTRLADLEDMSASDPKLELVEAGIAALGEEMADITRFYSSMLSIAEEASPVSASLGLEDRIAQKGLAAKALEMRAGAGGIGADGLRTKEEQVARREEMVDRKIKGYAQKKKELDDREAELSARFERIQREQALLEEMKSSAEPSGNASVRENERAEMERESIRRLLRMEATLKGEQDSREPEEGMTMDDRMSSLEASVRNIRDAKEEADLRLHEHEGDEDEVRRLLKTLDQLLGQLPESVVQKFTQSEDYKIYERVLDRLKI